MIGGQCADICAEELPSDQVTKELLWYIHKNKTAALIEAALMIGAVLAGAPDEAVKKLEQAAENIGHRIPDSGRYFRCDQFSGGAW